MNAVHEVEAQRDLEAYARESYDGWCGLPALLSMASHVIEAASWDLTDDAVLSLADEARVVMTDADRRDGSHLPTNRRLAACLAILARRAAS